MPEFIWEIPPESPSSSSSTVVPDGAIDHVAAALNRLVVQFRKPKMQAMVRIFAKPVQAVEDAILQLLTERTLDNAEGEQLQVIARIVGQQPLDVDDDMFRSIVKARIPANKSRGTGDEILKVVRIALSTYAEQEEVLAAGAMRVRLMRYYPASYVLRLIDIDLTWELAELVTDRFLEQITGTGIKPRLSFFVQQGVAYDSHQTGFSFNNYGTSSPSTGGWGDRVAGGIGGVMSSAMG